MAGSGLIPSSGCPEWHFYGGFGHGTVKLVGRGCKFLGVESQRRYTSQGPQMDLGPGDRLRGTRPSRASKHALTQTLHLTCTSSVRKRCVTVVSCRGVRKPDSYARRPACAIMMPLSMQNLSSVA